MSQTTYTTEAALALPGMIGEGGKRFSISRANENAAAMGAGQAVVAGTDPETQGELPSSAGEVFLGIVTSEQGREVLDSAGATSFATDENMELLRQGQVWVNTEIAVAAGDAAWFRHTDNGGLLVGPDGWRNDVDTSNAQNSGGVYITGNAAAGLALISINLP